MKLDEAVESAISVAVRKWMGSAPENVRAAILDDVRQIVVAAFDARGADAGYPKTWDNPNGVSPEHVAVPGDLEPHCNIEKTVDIVRRGYDWQVGSDGYLAACISGDMGYAVTHIHLAPDAIHASATPLAAISAKLDTARAALRRYSYGEGGWDGGQAARDALTVIERIVT